MCAFRVPQDFFKQKKSTDCGTKPKTAIEPSQCGTANEVGIFDQQKKKEMEEIYTVISSSDEANAASAEKYSEKRATNTQREAFFYSLSLHPDQPQPTASSFCASRPGPEEEPTAQEKVPTSEENGSQHGGQSDPPDFRNCSMREIMNCLRQMGAQTEDGVIKVDADYLIRTLGVDDAKKLVAFFNKESSSMDLVFTEGAWYYNQDLAATNEGDYAEIPESYLRLLRKLAVGLLETGEEMLQQWKDGCERSCEILKDTLENMRARDQRAEERHAAAMMDIDEISRRTKADHEASLRKLQSPNVAPAQAGQEKRDGEAHCGSQLPNTTMTYQSQGDVKKGTIYGFLECLLSSTPDITFPKLEKMLHYMKSVGATSDEEIYKINREDLASLIGAETAERILETYEAMRIPAPGGKENKKTSSAGKKRLLCFR